MTPNRWQEIVPAFVTLVWGIVFMLPGDLFGTIERYKYFNKFAPDWGYGLIMAICAVGILSNIPPRYRCQFHAVLAVMWILIVVLSSLSTFSPPVLLFTSLMVGSAFRHAFEFLRLSEQGRLA